MNFVLSVPQTQRGMNYVSVIIDMFSKMTPFISYRKTFDTIYILQKDFWYNNNNDKTIFRKSNSSSWDAELIQ